MGRVGIGTSLGAIAVGALTAWSACSSGSGSGQVTVSCTPGETQACLGSGACHGAQVCASDGKSYGPCDCGADGGAGSGSSSGGGSGSSSSGSNGVDSNVPGGSLRLEAPKAVAHLPPLNQPDAGACGPDGYCASGNACSTVVGATSDTYGCCPTGTAAVSTGCETTPSPGTASECCPTGDTLCGSGSTVWCCPSSTTCGSSNGTCDGIGTGSSANVPGSVGFGGIAVGVCFDTSGNAWGCVVTAACPTDPSSSTAACTVPDGGAFVDAGAGLGEGTICTNSASAWFCRHGSSCGASANTCSGGAGVALCQSAVFCTNGGTPWCCPAGSTCGSGSNSCNTVAQGSSGFCTACGGGVCGRGSLGFQSTTCDTSTSQCIVQQRNGTFIGSCPTAEPVDCGGPDGGAPGHGCCGADTQCCSAGQCCPTGYACCGDGNTCCPPGTTCSGNGCIATTGTAAGTVTIITTCPSAFSVSCGLYCCPIGTSCCSQGCCQ